MIGETHSTRPPSQDDEAPTVRSSATLTQTASYFGLLPSAAELHAYENVVPGAAERIVRMAESYAEHTRELEETGIRLVHDSRKRGMGLGTLVVLAVLGSCLYALHLDKETFAIALGTGTLVALVVVFIVGKVHEFSKIRLERDSRRVEGTVRRRGQWLGAIVVIAGFGSCLYALHLDKETFAIALAGTTLVALAAVFVLGKVPEWYKKTS